jgi:hypothetical protein
MAPTSRKVLIATARPLFALCLIALLLSPNVYAALESRSAFTAGQGGASSTQAPRKPSFRIKGKVGGLYPGARKKLKLKVLNPNPYTIKVSSIEVRVLKSNRTGCGRKVVKPARIKRLRLKLKPRKKARVAYPIKMKATAPGACKGARWPLRFEGRALRA